MDAIRNIALFPYPGIFVDIKHHPIVARVGNIDHSESPLCDLQSLNNISELCDCCARIKTAHPLLQMEAGVIGRGIRWVFCTVIIIIEYEHINMFDVKAVVVRPDPIEWSRILVSLRKATNLALDNNFSIGEEIRLSFLQQRKLNWSVMDDKTEI